MSKPLAASQSESAVGLVADSCTVSYGPKICCFSTVTPPPPPVGAAPPRLGGLGQVDAGGSIVVAVSASTASNSTSPERPTVTVPLMGRTHAKEEGVPL